MSNEGQGSRHDHLTATTLDGKIELTEQELSRAVGGAAVGDPSKTGKIKLTTAPIDKVDSSTAFE